MHHQLSGGFEITPDTTTWTVDADFLQEVVMVSNPCSLPYDNAILPEIRPRPLTDSAPQSKKRPMEVVWSLTLPMMRFTYRELSPMR